MKDIWTKINDDVPQYMDQVCKKYNMRCLKINSVSTALVNKDCCLIIEIGRFETDLIYAYVEDDIYRAYQCGSYLAARYNDDDRQGLMDIGGADSIVRNELIIMVNGLISKCEDIFLGKKWIEKYKQSSKFSEVNYQLIVFQNCQIFLFEKKCVSTK